MYIPGIKYHKMKKIKANKKTFYLAATGMITPVGCNTAMTVAAIKANISAYRLSDYYNKHFHPIKVASVPEAAFESKDIDATDWNSSYEFRLNAMANMAINEIQVEYPIDKPIPLLLIVNKERLTTAEHLIKNVAEKFPKLIDMASSRSIYGGRTAGMEAIVFAYDYMNDLESDFILIGGSDSYFESQRLQKLDNDERCSTEHSNDGFVPGEAAGFLLITTNPEYALVVDGHMVEICTPGIADESGHMYSDAPYLGDGLDQAVKKALMHYTGGPISRIYNTMNGERYWTKELGVTTIRNKGAFVDDVCIEHPADCYGDIASASAPILIALSALNLLTSSNADASLVYCSSDTEKRSAIVLKKVAVVEQLSKGTN